MIWWATTVECASALARLRRDGILTDAEEAAATAHLESLRGGWYEMLPADALQLAAALEWAGAPSGGAMVTLDDRLASAAAREGFTVLGA